MANFLYCGDNLEILRERVADASVDLIYLDPPFSSQRTYHAVDRIQGKREEAFNDRWSWADAAATYARAREDPRVPRRLLAMLGSLCESLLAEDSDLLAYLVMMAVRLAELHRKLAPTGSLYLHCDPTASHYLKILLDTLFGPRRFRSEIVWKRSAAHSDGKQGRAAHGHIHDTLLFYTKGDEWKWNPLYVPYSDAYVSSHYRRAEAGSGRAFQDDNLTAAKPGGDTSYEWRGKRPPAGRYWAYSREKMEQLEREGRILYTRSGMPRYKRYLDEMPGVPLQDLWTDIDPINSQAAERLGYPTQKPVALLDRIILSSSDPGDLVLDPFCGCGTTIESCERLGRRWIGIDIARKAVELVEQRLARASLPPPARASLPPPDGV